MVTPSARVLPYRSSLRKGKHHGFKTKREIHWIKFQGTCTMTTKVYSILNSCFVTNSRIFFLCLKSIHYCASLSHLLCVELHPVLQLLGDVLVLPFSQVGNEDPGIERASVGSHPQLLDSFFLEIQEANVIILLTEICHLIKHHSV